MALRAIIGGYWYRGSAVPIMAQRFIYSDFETRHVYLLNIPNRDRPFENATSTRLWLDPTPDNAFFKIAAFAEDLEGEIYVLNWQTPEIYRIESV